MTTTSTMTNSRFPATPADPAPAARATDNGTSDDQDWQERALCAQTDPEAFFPGKGMSVGDAKKVCRACEVRAECLEYALARNERFGVWGGLTERERRRIGRAPSKLQGSAL